MNPVFFEGQFKKSNTISYNREKQWSVSEITKNAELRRSQRAQQKKERAAANRWLTHHKLFISKTKKQSNFRQLFDQAIDNIQNSENKLQVLIKCIDYLSIFFNISVDEKRLISTINYLRNESIIREISGDLEINKYYLCASFSLILRLTIKMLSKLPNNSPAISYNNYLRIFEIIFLDYLKNLSINDKAKSDCIDILTRDLYFMHLKEFITNQFLIPQLQTPLDSILNQPKFINTINVLLKPLFIDPATSTTIITRFVTQLLHNTPNQYEAIQQLDFVIESLFKVQSVDIVIDTMYTLFLETTQPYKPSPSYLYLMLKCCQKIDLFHQTDLPRKLTIIISHFCRYLIDSNKLNLKMNSNITRREIIPMDMDNDYENDEDVDEEDEEDNDDCSTISHVSISDRKDSLDYHIISLLKDRFSEEILSKCIGDGVIDDRIVDSFGYLYNLLVLETSIIDSDQIKRLIWKMTSLKNGFVKYLWNSSSLDKINTTNESTSPTNMENIMGQLINGYISETNHATVDVFFGKLLCFANCLQWRLMSVQDLDLIDILDEKYREIMEFSPKELCDIVLKLRDIMYGLLQLLFSRKNWPEPFRNRIVRIFIELQRVVIKLYNRDVRKGLLIRGKRLDWVKPEIFQTNFKTIVELKTQIFKPRKRTQLLDLSKNTSISFIQNRQLSVLREMPFVIPFGSRLKLFTQIMKSLDVENGPRHFRMYSSQSDVHIRRNFMYEDAFSQITVSAYPDLRKLRIQFIDQFGMLEAGVDGGGLLREFLCSVIREACDPNRGLFCQTTDNQIYPNPEVDVIYKDNWMDHYHFVGRILGLIISRGDVIETPFAPFFIELLFASDKHTMTKLETDIDNLQYLDNVLYKNLLSLKSDAYLEDQHLDFVSCRSRYGTTDIVELKPGGANIPVNKDNVVEYIYLMANYRLNKAIVKQTCVIRDGFTQVISGIDSLFQLFDSDELSWIISGGSSSIDVEDLRRYTVYHGQLTYPEDCDRVIEDFWTILSEMTEEEKRNFIQFVTSNTRPPVLGFGELNPHFAIQLTGPDNIDRLPSSSTCVNLLKLPCYKTQQEMKEKLLKAIGSESGFHLS